MGEAAWELTWNETFWSVIAGAVIAAAVSWFFYREASEGL